jgi:hypothetical protein
MQKKKFFLFKKSKREKKVRGKTEDKRADLQHALVIPNGPV